MGLFKSLLKKNEEPLSSSLASEFSDFYTGMKVEVLTPANALLFVGKLRVLEGGDLLEVRSEAGGYLPRALYNQAVKLRLFHRDGGTYTLNGTVGQNSFRFWRIENLKYLQNSENRSFFRQNTNVPGWVYPITSSKGQKFACSVLDVSAGGARVVTTKLFQLGGTFQLELSILPGEPPFNVTCKVTRTLVRAQPGSPIRKFEYGCQFVDVPPREQERLLQTIFTLQRKVLQARRDQ